MDTPEAEVEDVLDSLRLRIRHMFKWAKSEVDGFDDLSPLDQKALLRRTVSELVMLGFARVSIPYDGKEYVHADMCRVYSQVYIERRMCVGLVVEIANHISSGMSHVIVT